MRSLYHVRLRGHGDAFEAYVVASNPDRAVRIFQRVLEQRDVGFDRDRVLECVTLVAVADRHAGHPTQLLVQAGD